jgi:hypothetical protein
VRKLTLVVAALTAAVSIVGTGVALADDAPKQPTLIDAVAAQLGTTPDALRSAFKAAVVARIQASDRLTDEQKAKLIDRVGKANGLGLGARDAFRKKAQAFKQRVIARSGTLGIAAKVTGLDRQTIVERLRKGESLGAIAGGKRQALIDALVAQAKTRLAKAQQRLDAATGISDDTRKRIQARLDKGASTLVERVTKLVDHKRKQTA